MDKVNNTRIGNIAVTAVQNYINDCPKLNHDIHTNDTIPVYDGDILVYKVKNSNKSEDYLGPVRVQVKGSTDFSDDYYIDRSHVEVYENAGGCIFFKVLEIEGPKDILRTPQILYKILYLDDIRQLLQKNTKNIRIKLEKLPNCEVFEKKVSDFATSVGREKVIHSSPKEIGFLVNEFVKLRKSVFEIKDKIISNELDGSLDIILNLKDDGTMRWRNKFIYHSRKALDLAIINLKTQDFAELLYHFGSYLYEQKQYQYVEKYYKTALEQLISQSKTNNGCVENCAYILNSLGNLYKKLERYEESKVEYDGALKTFETLYRLSPDNYKSVIAMVLNNLANLNSKVPFSLKAKWYYKKSSELFEEIDKVTVTLNSSFPKKDKTLIVNYWEDMSVSFDETEEEWQYKKALQLYKELEQDNPGEYIGKIAMILNNLGSLYLDNQYNKKKDSEDKLLEALDIYNELEETNQGVYNEGKAMTLYNLGLLHSKLRNNDKAEVELKESIELFKELAKSNHYKYDDDEAGSRIQLSYLYLQKEDYENAKEEAKTVLNIFDDETKVENTDVFIVYVIKAKLILAVINMQQKQYEIAEKEFDEIIKVFDNTNTDSYKYYDLLAWVLTYQGIVCNALNKHDKASKVLELATRIQLYGLESVLEDFKSGIEYSDKMTKLGEKQLKELGNFDKKIDTPSFLSRIIDWINK